jgi:DNA (cytosine-5)-methyltransferase 1
MSWLISQALMNSLCLQEQVEEYLAANSLDGEQSAPLNGKPIQQAYCAPDKMTDFSRLSRFGMTFKPLTDILGEELLTLYLAGFHAKTSAQQEKAQELMENDQECGEKWLASFVKYDPDTSSWKTHQCSLLGDLDEFSETWPQWGLMRNGECWEQRTLEQTIRGTGYGLSPNGVDSFHTPNTTGLDGGSNSRKALKKRQENWPTPYANCGQRGTQPNWTPKRKSGQPAQYTINQAVRDRFPTPQASDHRDRGNMSNPSVQRRVQIGKQISLSQSVHPTSGKLNPTWVEWLMGWPMQWTDLKRLEMDKFHFVQQQLGES